MAITDEQWMAFITSARFVQPLAVPVAPSNDIVGRSITKIVDKLCEFWTAHQATLIPYLTQAAIAALNALVASRTAIDVVNPPGPA